MAAAAPTYTPLDLDALRTALSAGRMVRVGVLPTGQFPAGTAGRVRAVGAPDTDGPEFIQVELTVGGAKDVVPFAPTDLSPLRRGQAAPEPLPRAATRPPARARSGAAGKQGTTARVTVPTAPTPTEPTLPTTAGRVSPTADDAMTPGSGRAPVVAVVESAPAAEAHAVGAAATAPATSGNPRADTAEPAIQRSEAGTTPPAASRPDANPAGTATRRTAASRRAGGHGRQPVAVTLSTAEPDHMAWTVQVTVGSRTVVKPTAVPPAQAWALVTGLGHPEVEQIVAGALAEHRRLAQDRADRLARELAEARAELAAYPTL